MASCVFSNNFRNSEGTTTFSRKEVKKEPI